MPTAMDPVLVFDHLLVLVVAVLWPAWEKYWAHPRWLRRLAAGIPGTRLRGYREAMALQWGLVAVLLAGWVVLGRPVDRLGLGWQPGWRFLLGAVLVLGILVLLELQRRRICRADGAGEPFRRALGPGLPIMPRTREERREFLMLSVTAGICEELLFRGFLIAYLAAWMPVWGAVVVSSALFGAAHAYLGLTASVRAGAAGLVAAGLYLLTGSLWAPMVFHAGVDMNAGLTSYDVLREPEPRLAGGEPATPA